MTFNAIHSFHLWKAFLCILFVSSFAVDTNAQDKNEQRIELDSFQPAQLSTEVIKYINQMRVSRGMVELVRSEPLELAAQAHATAMVEHDFFSHVSPVKGSKHLINRLSLVGVSKVYAAENLSLAFVLELKSGQPYYTRFDSEDEAKLKPIFSIEHKGVPIPAHTYTGLAAQVGMQWFNSTSHRLNMLEKTYNAAGVGAELGLNKQKMPIVKVVMTFAALSI